MTRWSQHRPLALQPGSHSGPQSGFLWRGEVGLYKLWTDFHCVKNSLVYTIWGHPYGPVIKNLHASTFFYTLMSNLWKKLQHGWSYSASLRSSPATVYCVLMNKGNSSHWSPIYYFTFIKKKTRSRSNHVSRTYTTEYEYGWSTWLESYKYKIVLLIDQVVDIQSHKELVSSTFVRYRFFIYLTGLVTLSEGETLWHGLQNGDAEEPLK